MNSISEEKINSKLSMEGYSRKLTLLELRGSISNVIGTTNLLLNNNNDEIRDIEKSIEKIHISALKSYTMLDNLVHQIKRKKGDYLVQSDSVDLNVIIKKAISFYAQLIISKKIEINLSIDTNSKISIQENLLSLIVRNILHNAIKYSHNGGKIELITKRESNYLNFVVIDNGIGMYPKNITQILQNNDLTPSYRVLSGEHSGIGLKLCKEYIKIIKGDLLIGSQLGKGSRFEVKLPLINSQNKK